jgi:hypothetical protein
VSRLSERRLTFGHVQLYIEPRDAWVGVFVGQLAVYVLPLPFVVIRWDRRVADRMAAKAVAR